MYAAHDTCVYTHVHTYGTHVTITRRNSPSVWCDIARSVLAGPPRWPSRTVAEKSIVSVVWCGVAASLFQVAACTRKEASLADERAGGCTNERASERASNRPIERASENESPARHTHSVWQARDRIPAFRATRRTRIYACIYAAAQR